MSKYLYMDGVDDYLHTPQVTVDRVIMDISVSSESTNTNLYIFTPAGATYVSSGLPVEGTFFSYVTKGNMNLYRNAIPSMKVNAGNNVTNLALVSNQRYSVDYQFNAITDPSIEFFVRGDRAPSTTTRGNIYRIRGFHLGSIVFDYDMSKGNVLDQSGNGNHATLVGGVWKEIDTKQCLLLDGVDDRIDIPSMTYTKIELDILPYRRDPSSHHYIGTPTASLHSDGTKEIYADPTNLEGIYVNGVKYGSGVRSIENYKRQRVEVVRTAPITSAIKLFTRNDAVTSFMAGKAFGAKIYNGSTLVALYDFTQGTALDLSGNGNHATIIGASWLKDYKINERTLVYDSFDRPDNTETLGTPDVGPAWKYERTTKAGIISGMGYVVKRDSESYSPAYQEVSSQNFAVESRMPVPRGNCGITFRFVDNGNWYILMTNVAAPGAWFLRKRVNGTFTTLWLDPANVAARSTDVMRIEQEGSTIRLYKNGILQVTLENETDLMVADPVATPYKVGFTSQESDPGLLRVDDFVIELLEPPAPPTKKYLSMDGIDDWVATPGGIFMSRIVIEFSATNPQPELDGIIVDARDGSPIRIVTASLQYSEILMLGQDAVNVTLNGVPITSEYPIEPDTKYVLDITATGVTEYGSSGITFFSNTYRDSSFFRGNLYDIKVYEGPTLVLHYDLTKGTLQDQSGNGRHGVLYGGTFLQSGGVEIDVKYSYPMKQSIYVDRKTSASMKQSIYVDRKTSASMKQSIYANRSTKVKMVQQIHANRTTRSFLMKQVIYASRKTSFPMKISMFKEERLTIPLRQVIYADRSYKNTLKQQIYEDVSKAFPIKIIIYNDTQLVTRELFLEGEISYEIWLGGDLKNMKRHQDFKMFAGEYMDLKVTVPGLPMNAQVIWALKPAHETAVSMVKTPSDGITVEDGKLTITLTDKDTENLSGTYFHQAQVKDVLGRPITIMIGDASFDPGIIPRKAVN